MSYRPANTPQHVGVPGKPAAALILPLLLAACASASNSHQATKDDYHRDALNCRTQSSIKPKVRTNLGGNLSADLVAGVAPDQYLRCMAGLGWKQDAKTDPLLKALNKCRDKAARPVTISGGAGGTTVGSGIDQAAFGACMNQRGFGEVTLEPLQPASAP